MGRVQFTGSNIAVNVLTAAACTVWWLLLRKRRAEAVSFDAARLQACGADPMTMALPVSCDGRSGDDNGHHLSMPGIRAWQLRLAVYRLCCALFLIAVLIAAMIDVGWVLLTFFTVWNFAALCAYFAVMGALTLSEHRRASSEASSPHRTADWPIREACWVFLGCELALTLHIFVVVWFLFYPAAGREDRRRLETSGALLCTA